MTVYSPRKSVLDAGDHRIEFLFQIAAEQIFDRDGMHYDFAG